ncbi:MAG: hypothetical protein HYV42_00315 [Candidatus Magasanikbacteria bacterium]|nr:hypothetical protein [Candidatus Magasanikbacteria bacterium]
MRLWFVLGRQPLLSAAELFAVLGPLPLSATDYRHQPLILKLNLPPAAPAPQQLMPRLGGTIKIGEGIASNLPEGKLLERMGKELQKIKGKIHYGISGYGDHPREIKAKTIARWGKEIKRRLQSESRSVRYVFKNEPALSSVTVTQNKLTDKGKEFLVSLSSAEERARGEVRYDLALTRAVQPFKEFSARDYGRPARDDRSGLLPPKLAMIMINLAAGPRSSLRLLDPFCGSGTILTEALLLGHRQLIGADISEQAIQDTQKNITWIANQIAGLPSSIADLPILPANVTALSQKIPPAAVDAIVTEPALGPPLTGKEKIAQIKKTAQELNRLYFQAFREFKKILCPGGAVVFIFPRFLVKGEWITVSPRVVPDIEKLGFTVEPLLPKELHPEPFGLYHRPGQWVAREIWRFRNFR